MTVECKDSGMTVECKDSRMIVECQDSRMSVEWKGSSSFLSRLSFSSFLSSCSNVFALKLDMVLSRMQREKLRNGIWWVCFFMLYMVPAICFYGAL